MNASPEPLYRCPVLEDFGDYDRQYKPTEYDPREFLPLDKMKAHLRENGYTPDRIETWTKTARPI